MADKFATFGDSPVGPAREAFAIVPHDSNPISPTPKALIIGGAGNIRLQAIDSGAAVIIAVSAGQQLDIRANLVLATGTTATGIVGLA